jgi:hypothetical protein
MRVDGEGPGGTGVREVAVPEEAVAAAEALGAAVRGVAASLPFGADPGAFAAALERLAGDDDIEEALP